MIVMQRIAHWYEHRHDEMIAVSLLPSVHSHVYCQRYVRLPLGAANGTVLHCCTALVKVSTDVAQRWTRGTNVRLIWVADFWSPAARGGSLLDSVSFAAIPAAVPIVIDTAVAAEVRAHAARRFHCIRKHT